MKIGALIDKIQIIEKPIDYLFKLDEYFNKIIDSIRKKREGSIVNKKKNYSSRIYLFGVLFVASFIGLIGYSAFETIKGDYPIYKKVPDGAICNDGWRSYSQGPGTCSWHGGVNYYMYKDLEIGNHYANPIPYLIAGLIVLSIGIIFMYLNKPLRFTVGELFLKLAKWIYFIFHLLFLTFPLIFLRAALQLILIIPSLLFYTILNIFKPRK